MHSHDITKKANKCTGVISVVIYPEMCEVCPNPLIIRARASSMYM